MQLHRLKYLVSVENTGSITKVNSNLTLIKPSQKPHEQTSKILQKVENTKYCVNDFVNVNGGLVSNRIFRHQIISKSFTEQSTFIKGVSNNFPKANQIVINISVNSHSSVTVDT